MNPNTLSARPKDITELPKTRIEAHKLGFTKYFTNKACKNGHIAYRYVASGICSVCASNKAKKAWANGVRQNTTNRLEVNKKWNHSEKGKIAKQRWKDKNPKRAWAVYATGAAKVRAALKNLAFDLTSDYVESITPDGCPVFNEQFLFIGNKTMQPFSASLDRLDPTKGYVQGNVVVVSMKANSIKNAYGSKEVLAVGAWLHKQGL
jgi:hypothetical protein